MRNITTDELALIHGAGLDKDASVAIGTAAGGFLGKATKIPGADIAGSAIGGYIGGVIADGSNRTITIPSNGINYNPGIGLGSFNPNYNGGLLNSGFNSSTSSSREGANKQVISSQADSLIKISRIWADFFPANTSNQPI